MSNAEWHQNETKIKNQLLPFFRNKDYVVEFHSYRDTFDMVCSKITDDYEVEKIIGVEIKSDNDNFSRLEKQLTQYIRVFDKIYLALEEKDVPEYVPPFVGIIRCNSETYIERAAEELNHQMDYVSGCVLAKTIKDSGGIQNRSKELAAYVKEMEYVKRKLLHNTFFINNRLPFSQKEKNLINFINKRFIEIKDLELFGFDCGEVVIDNGKRK